MDIAEVRAKFPQYSDMSDADLASALHKKFYSDIPYSEFAGKIGLKADVADPLGQRAALQPKEGVVRLGETLAGIPRQIGLTARAGLQGVGGLVGVATDPIAATMNLSGASRGMFGQDLPFARQTARSVADMIGLPSPATPTERVAGQTAELMAGSGGAIGAGRALAASPGAATLAKDVGALLSTNPAQQVGSSIGAGVAGGSAREGGAGPGGEFAASLLGAVAGGTAPSAIDSVSSAAKRLLARPIPPQQIDIQIAQVLAKQGVDYAALPQAAKASLRAEMASALSAQREVSPEALRRLADFKTIGATPTRGTVTLDPVQITREQNLMRTAANMSEGDLSGLPRIANQNNKVLIGAVNDIAGTQGNAMSAGGKAIDTIAGRDAAMKASESSLYQQARDQFGRALPLDRTQFLNETYRKLAEQNKGAFLPGEIDDLLQQIRDGVIKKGGQEYAVPFNVDVIDNLKTTLAAASRSSKDGNTRAAVSIVRDALENTQPAPNLPQFGGSQVVTQGGADAMRGVQGAPASAMAAFDAARKAARERRVWQESAPAIKAALEDVAPDQFVQKFVLSPSSSASDVKALAAELKSNPDAMQSMRASITQWLKERALSGAADEVGKFSQSGYNKALTSLQNKLPAFFSPEEIAQLNAVGRVASYTQVQPVGSAVNNSNSGALVVGRALDALSGMSKYMPFGKAAIADPLQQLRITLNTRDALNVGPGLLATRSTTPTLTGSALLPAAMSAGLLAP